MDVYGLGKSGAWVVISGLATRVALRGVCILRFDRISFSLIGWKVGSCTLAASLTRLFPV
jgi:hypothetical protein